ELHHRPRHRGGADADPGRHRAPGLGAGHGDRRLRISGPMNMMVKMTMRRTLRNIAGLALASAFVAAGGAAVASADRASADEAVAMVGQGVAYIQAKGTEAGYAEITGRKQGRLIDRNLYLVVYGFDGVVPAHVVNKHKVGKNLIDLRDVDAKPSVRERAELGRKNPGFWQDYEFTNPVSRQIEPKKLY